MKRIFEEMIEVEYNRFYSVAFRLVGNHYDTQDILQTSFLNAYKNLDNFQGKSKLSTWVYTIIINESKRFLGKKRPLPISEIIKHEGITEDTFFERFKVYA